MTELLETPTRDEVIAPRGEHFSFPNRTPVSAPDLDPASLARRRRRIRWARFVGAEIFAVAVMILSVVAGVSARFADQSLTPIFRVLPITAAAVVVILPIIFFGDPKRRRR